MWLQFAGQEPGDNDTIKKFAKQRGVEFPMMSKVDVNGSNGEGSELSQSCSGH